MRHGRLRLLRVLGLVAVLALLVAACAEEEPVDEPEEPDEVEEPEEEPDEEEPDVAEPEGGPVTIGMVEWAENIANTALWTEILEEEGYDVSVEVLDPGAVFAGVAQGDLDFFLDVWLPVTHADYIDDFGDDVHDLGLWYDGEAGLNMTVPEYVEEDAIPDLVGEGDKYDSTIVGIDAGSGLAQTTNEAVMPGYGLDDDGWTHEESSEAAMLTELDSAIRDEEPVVVTLWTPHWAYAEYDLKVLEDPEGHYGDLEELSGIAREGLPDEDPVLVEWLENFMMTEDQLGELSGAVEEAEDAEGEREAAREWIEDNRDVVDEWLGR